MKARKNHPAVMNYERLIVKNTQNAVNLGRLLKSKTFLALKKLRATAPESDQNTNWGKELEISEVKTINLLINF